MADEYMQMEHEKRMTKRDKARAKFVKEFKRKQLAKKNLKNQIITEREKFLDIEEQIQYKVDKPLNQMKYDELLGVLNRDQEAIQMLSGVKGSQLKIFED